MKQKAREKVERLYLKGVSVRRIALRYAINAGEVEAILNASAPVRELRERRSERRILRMEAERRLTCSDIGPASEVDRLSNHRLPDGSIDWESVPGYLRWSQVIREELRQEEMAAVA